jgi:hypothetical protein
VFGWVKKAAKAVGHAVKGAVSAVVQTAKAVVHRVLGLPELIGTLLNWMPEKQIAVEMLILRKNNKPLANFADAQAVLDLADEVYRDQMHVHIVNRQGRRPLELAAVVPGANLSVTCAPLKVLASDFSGVSDWFRDHQVRKTSGTVLGYGQPVTVFVVENVEGDNAGCCPGWLTDYAVIDPGVLHGSEAMKLLLAHEVAHACGLWHPLIGKKKNLMKHEEDRRNRRLGRLQKAIFRSSGHVTRSRFSTITG